MAGRQSDVTATVESQEPLDDIFLNIQSATILAKNIYYDYFSLSKAEFLKNIEGLANELELRYARDMMFAITRRRMNFHGNLCERKSSDTGLKEKLCLDIYTLYTFNEGSISALPKNMLKSEAIQTTEHLTQTDADMKFVLQKDLDSLKLELLEKIEVIQSSLLKLSSEPKTETNTEKLVKTSPPPVVSAAGSGISDTGKRSAQDKTSKPHDNPAVSSDSASIKDAGKESIIYCGDSLLHRMIAKKMHIGDKKSIKLTKRGDCLEGSINRLCEFLEENPNCKSDIVLLAGTNDLRKHQSSAGSLVDSINKLKDFDNVKQIFVCKLPPRSDIATVNVKVNLYNQLVSSKCSEMNSVHIVETIPLERQLFYKDGLHFSDLGLNKQCKIILSKLYSVIAPHLKRKHAPSNRTSKTKSNKRTRTSSQD